ncbi:MAG: hypothetical protein JWO79_419 [Actinomycetia bacterium]|jgi:hypothetical protein|nr:hypothetical protein [Actinomycetes bacterium]MDQ1655561.1 hypothetical protein [Cryptosporangiaceae bacterium]
MTNPEPSQEMRDEAHQRIEDMPAETALGNRDPQGGGKGEPEDFKGHSEE